MANIHLETFVPLATISDVTVWCNIALLQPCKWMSLIDWQWDYISQHLLFWKYEKQNWNCSVSITTQLHLDLAFLWRNVTPISKPAHFNLVFPAISANSLIASGCWEIFQIKLNKFWISDFQFFFFLGTEKSKTSSTECNRTTWFSWD